MSPLVVAPSQPRGWKDRSLAVWRTVWARRWKLLGIAAVYALGRSCAYWPDAAAPFCELLYRMAKAFP